MLVPFVRSEFEGDLTLHQDFNGYIPTRSRVTDFDDLRIFNKDNSEIAIEEAVAGDTFTFSHKNYTINGEKTLRSERASDGYFVNSTPFKADFDFVKLYQPNKGVFLLNEKGTNRYQLIYPAEMVDVIQAGSISNGSMTGVFKYVRKGTVYSLQFVANG